MFLNVNSNHFYISSKSTYQNEKNNAQNVKYFFISENHDERFKTESFIKNNYREGDLILVENFSSMSKIDQKNCASIKNLDKKVDVIGWDLEEMSVDSDYPSGSISAEINKLSLYLTELYKNYCIMFDSIKMEIDEIQCSDILDEIEELYFKREEEIKKKETPLQRINESSLIKKYDTLKDRTEINIKNSESAIKILTMEIPILIDNTTKKIKEYHACKEGGKPIDISILDEICFNARLLRKGKIILKDLEKKFSNYLLGMEKNLNSQRIIKTFQDRTSSMINTLEKVSSHTGRIFIIAGMNHFVEGKDATRYSEMRLKNFYKWLTDKPAIILALQD